MSDEIASALPVPEIDEILAEVRLIKGREALARNDWTEAIWHFSSGLKSSPGQIEFYTKLAEVLGGDSGAWKRVHQLLVKAIKMDPGNQMLREKLLELRAMRRSQREETNGNGKIDKVAVEIVEESADALTASSLASSKEFNNEVSDFDLVDAIIDDSSEEVEIDLSQDSLVSIAAGAALSEEDSLAEDESLHPDARNAIGCYFSPGNAVFYVKLTDALDQEEEVEDLHADESGELFSLQKDRYDEADFKSAKEAESASVAKTAEELANIDLMLAEVSFIDGNELLAKGDRTGAILHFRDALSYAPGVPEYYLKLAKILAEDPSTLKEAKLLLVKAIKIWPRNTALREAFVELRKPVKRSKNDQSPRKNRRSHKTNRGNVNAQLRSSGSSALDPDKLIEELAELEKKAAAELMKKARKRRFLSLRVSQKAFVSADKLLPQKIAGKRWAVLAAMALVVLMGLGYGLLMRGNISPIMPVKNKALAAQDLMFQWDCSEQGLTYVIKVYDQGELVMCQFTKERSYAPDLLQKSMFQAGNVYSWEVLATRNVYKGYKYITEPQNFYISKPIEPRTEKPPDQIGEKPSDQTELEVKSVPNKNSKRSKPPALPLPQTRID